MTRSFYFLGGLVALFSAFVVQSVVRVPAPVSGAVVEARTVRAAAPVVPDATSVAIDDLAAWPAAAGR